MWSDITRKKPVHILVNNAAIAHSKKFSELKFEEFQKTINTNLMAYVYLMKYFLEQKNLDSTFRIVNIISIAGMTGATSVTQTDYSASKAALTSFTDALR